jgi:hypothetical protein
MPYLGKSPSAGVRQRYQYTATAGQTTFTGTDLGNLTLTYTDNNFVDVFQNGVLLKGGGTDYTATSGTSVVLATGASVSDVIEIIVYDVFSVGNFFNRTDSDSRYLSAAKGIDDQSSSNDDQLTITDTAVVINEDSDDVDFRVESNGNTHALFVDAGNDHVNIGTDTDLGGTLNVNGEIRVSNADAGLILTENANDANGSNLVLRKSRNTTLNAHTVVQDDDTLGSISFQGSDGDEFITGTSLVSKVDYAPGNDDLGAKFEINISRDGTKTTAVNTVFDSFNSTDNAKLQRVNCGYNGGNMSTRNCGLHVGGHRYYHTAIHVEDYDSATSYSSDLITFTRNDNNCGEIVSTSATSCSYSTSSDYRIKMDVQELDEGINSLKKLSPKKFKFKSEEGLKDENGKDIENPYVQGFIAHEVQEALTNSKGIVVGTKDETDAEGKMKTQGMDYGKLTPLLTKALQEAVAKIETLETKNDALEARIKKLEDG